MQSAISLASLSSNASSASSHSSTYGSRTVLDASDLPSASARCRSSIVSYLDNDETLFAAPPPPPPPPRRRSHMPTSTTTRSTPKCRHLFRNCLSSSSTSSPLSMPVQDKLSSSASVRQRYFAQLCQNHRLLLVLTDYDCRCGCHFSMRQGAFVILYESKDQTSLSPPSLSKRDEGVVTVISSDLVCSKVPMEYVCDVDVLRERVRARQLYDEEQSFDL